MREIKFRGRNKDGIWFYGFFTIGLDSFFIEERYDVPPNMSDPCGDTIVSRDMILPETVEQYTGLKDKSGDEVYEGDRFAPDDPEDNSRFTVSFEDGAFRKKYDKWSPLIRYNPLSKFDLGMFHKIGNIHEEGKL